MRCFTLVALLLAASCEDKSAADGGEKAPPPPPPSSVFPAADEALQIRGTLPSKSGVELTYKQAFDAGHIEQLVACGANLLALSDGGRIVEWDPKTKKVKQTFRGLAGITSIHANEGVLLAGAADGRLLRTDCDGRDPVLTPETSLSVQWVHLDLRSRKRAFVVYQDPATAWNKLPGTMANVALVDLETGRAAKEPFRRAWPKGGYVFGFVDYRGELWFGATPTGTKSTVWYLERFDDTQPSLAGLGEEVVRGFLQVSREVWAFGGSVDGARGFIYRVDSNRTKMLWDGEEAWFGSPPGGDVPQAPIVGMHKRGNDLIVIASDGIYRTDKELRRWRRFETHDPDTKVLASATETVELQDTTFVGTHQGLVTIDESSWTRHTVPAGGDRSAPDDLAQSLTWRGTQWSIGKRERLQVAVAGKNQRKPRSRPRRAVHGFFVDALDRLFVFADDGLWMFTGVEKNEHEVWDVTDLGLAARVIVGAGLGGKDDALELSTSYGGHLRLRIPQP